jgi:hypothetical protein
MTDHDLGKLIGATAEAVASTELGWDDTESAAEELAMVRDVYDRIHKWCDGQMVALTELIEQHRQQAAATLGK